MRLWLDDIREPPDEDWLWVKTAEAAFARLNVGDIDFASLDHDLGYLHTTGYDLVKWMAEHNVWPSHGITVHSWNPAGAENMCKTINRYGPYEERTRAIPCAYYESPKEVE